MTPYHSLSFTHLEILTLIFFLLSLSRTMPHPLPLTPAITTLPSTSSPAPVTHRNNPLSLVHHLCRLQQPKTELHGFLFVSLSPSISHATRKPPWLHHPSLPEQSAPALIHNSLRTTRSHARRQTIHAHRRPPLHSSITVTHCLL